VWSYLSSSVLKVDLLSSGKTIFHFFLNTKKIYKYNLIENLNELEIMKKELYKTLDLFIYIIFCNKNQCDGDFFPHDKGMIHFLFFSRKEERIR